MSVTVNCSINKLAVELMRGQQQQLRYTVIAQGDLVCTLRSEKQMTLLPDALNPTVVERIWPQDASEDPTGPDVTHSLGIAFGAGSGSVQWRIEKIGAGASLGLVKDCTYSSRDVGDKFFDEIHIYLV